MSYAFQRFDSTGWRMSFQERLPLWTSHQGLCLSLPKEGWRLHRQGQGRGRWMPLLQEGDWMPILLQDWSMPTQAKGTRLN